MIVTLESIGAEGHEQSWSNLRCFHGIYTTASEKIAVNTDSIPAHTYVSSIPDCLVSSRFLHRHYFCPLDRYRPIRSNEEVSHKTPRVESPWSLHWSPQRSTPGRRPPHLATSNHSLIVRARTEGKVCARELLGDPSVGGLYGIINQKLTGC